MTKKEWSLFHDYFSEYSEYYKSKGYVLDSALVVGPYPSTLFIDQLLRKLRPAAVRLYLDSGTPDDLVAEIAKMGTKKTKMTVAMASAATGLLHAKMYVLRWLRVTQRSRKEEIVLFWGSANASQGGFSVNAEVLSSVEVATLARKDIQALQSYLAPLSTATGQTKELDLKLSAGAYVRLPAFKFGPLVDMGFDAWLRRGKLCHKFAPDPSFGRISVNLLKPLQAQGAEAVMQQDGFMREGESRTVRREYVSARTSDREYSPQWRARYFAETIYGHWTSAACRRDEQAGKLDAFRLGAREGRMQLLESLRSAGDKERRAWAEDHVDALSSLHRSLVAGMIDPAEYLLLGPDGRIDRQKYSVLAMNQIARDQAKAAQASFAERYAAGYDFPRVPSLGDDFDAFAESWCDSILHSLSQGTVMSLQARAIRTVLSKVSAADYPQTGSELLALLRANWSQWMGAIDAFHRNE